MNGWWKRPPREPVTRMTPYERAMINRMDAVLDRLDKIVALLRRAFRVWWWMLRHRSETPAPPGDFTLEVTSEQP